MRFRRVGAGWEPLPRHRVRGEIAFNCFGMEMGKRPNCIGIGTAKQTEELNRKSEFLIEKEGDTFGEPVWVWRKCNE